MNFYQEIGSLVLGTRLKRQSDYFLSEMNKVYKDNGIPFEASWFGVFYLLDAFGKLSILDMSEKLEVSHSAISQLIKVLENKKLVKMETSKTDARSKIITFTKKGFDLLIDIKPIWTALDQAMEVVLEKNALLNNITKLENQFALNPLNKRINSCLITEKIS